MKPPQMASELRLALGQLIRRLRAERGTAVSLSQLTVLGRLDRDGPQSVSDLAAGERIRQQSMAETVKDLESAGMVSRRQDPEDGRRQIVELTAHGTKTLEADRRQRVGWLAGAIEGLDPADREALGNAIPVLRRLAERD